MNIPSKKVLAVYSLISASILSGCANSGQGYRSDVYKANQVNQAQEAKTVQIISVMPAKIEVENKDAQTMGQITGALLGGIAGAAIGSNAGRKNGTGMAVVGAGAGALAGNAISGGATTLVDGVQLTYVYTDPTTKKSRTLNSTQVGRLCEFKPGSMALMISSQYNETRIQPNAVCPQVN